MVSLKTDPQALAARSRGDDMPRKCAWCGEVRELDGMWRALSSFDPRDSSFSHGICPRCLESTWPLEMRR